MQKDYFISSYFGACRATHISNKSVKEYVSLILEYLKLVDFLNFSAETKKRILVFFTSKKFCFSGTF